MLISVKKIGEAAPKYRYADFLRTAYMNYFKLGPLANVSMSSNSTPTADVNVMLPVDDITVNLAIAAASGDGATATPFTMTNADARYYEVTWNMTTGTYSLTYQTDTYLCPFSSIYSDVHGVFNGCTPSDAVPGNIHAAYVIQAHACGSRQFFNGTCNDVSSNCNTFDPLSGKCFSCANLTYTKVNGVCSAPVVVVTCAAGTYNNGGTCIPDNCSAVDATGNCTSCIKVTYQLVSGKCTLKTCPTGQALNSTTGNCDVQCATGEQNIKNVCHTIPKNCLSLAPHLACNQCESGFVF